MNKLIKPAGPQVTAQAAILIRLMVGGVFLVEGLLKFLHPEELAAGRFAKIGIPAPELMGPFVAGVETICGALVLLGLFTRLAAVPLLLNISVAILSTKIPVLLGHGFLGLCFSEAAALRFPEHGSRGPHGLFDVAWVGLSADRWRRLVVLGVAFRPG